MLEGMLEGMSESVLEGMSEGVSEGVLIRWHARGVLVGVLELN